MLINECKRILVCPLDWGLGHTTRCIPLIGWLRLHGHTVIFAGNETQRSFIDNVFPGIEKIHLDGYNVIYGRKQGFEKLTLLSQLPGLHMAIKKEHEWLKMHTKSLQVDGVISDNRYGLHHSSVPSVIITHQLQVQTGLGNLMNRAVQKIHYKFLDQFNDTWIPDVSGPVSLGGNLSHTSSLPHSAQYIGLLSQFGSTKNVASSDSKHILILLSGPEPQRSILADCLWQQAIAYTGKVVFVNGSEYAPAPASIPPHITFHKRISGLSLETIINDSSLVICRSGYSTLMDLIRLGKRALLIPTPGQTEQEYLAAHLQKMETFPYMLQKRFDFLHALTLAAAFPYHHLSLQNSFGDFQLILNHWISSL